MTSPHPSSAPPRSPARLAQARLADALAAGSVPSEEAWVAAGVAVFLAKAELPAGAGPDALYDRAVYELDVARQRRQRD